MASIEIFNDDNYVLIDDTSLNHRLVGKKESRSHAAVALPSVVDAEFQIPASSETFPIFALRPPDGYWSSFHSSAATASQVSWRYMTTAPTDTPHECYVFQDGLSDPLKGTGLVVLWNEEGVVTFDSDANYAAFVDMVEVKPNQYFTRVYKPGRKYAVCNSVPMVWRTSVGPGGGYSNVSAYGSNVTDNKITFGKYQYRGTLPGLNSSGNETAAWFIVLDVTGI